jgi:hypothetical protein
MKPPLSSTVTGSAPRFALALFDERLDLLGEHVARPHILGECHVHHQIGQRIRWQLISLRL